MESTKNHYELLQVSRTAGNEVIDGAFRSLSKLCHPDKFLGNVEKEKEFKALTQARDILTDSAKRRKYDEYLNSFGQVHQDYEKDTQKARAQGHNPQAPDPLRTHISQLIDMGLMFAGPTIGVPGMTMLQMMRPQIEQKVIDGLVKLGAL